MVGVGQSVDDVEAKYVGNHPDDVDGAGDAIGNPERIGNYLSTVVGEGHIIERVHGSDTEMEENEEN